MTRTILVLAAILLLGSAAHASDCTITLAQYSALKMGSSYEEVVKVFGCEGVEISRAEIPGMNTSAMYAWDGPSLYSGATVMFVNNKLISRSQILLTPPRSSAAR